MQEYIVEFIKIGELSFLVPGIATTDLKAGEKDYAIATTEWMDFALEGGHLQIFDYYKINEADDAANDYPEKIDNDTFIIRLQMGVHEDDIDLHDHNAFIQYIRKALQERPAILKNIIEQKQNNFIRQIKTLSLWHPDSEQFDVQSIVDSI